MTLATDVQHSVQLPRFISQQALQVTDKAVDVAFAGRLAYNVFVIVVAQTSTQLLIIHLGFVLPPTPQQSHLETKLHQTPEDNNRGMWGICVLHPMFSKPMDTAYLIRVCQLELPPISCPAYT